MRRFGYFVALFVLVACATTPEVGGKKFILTSRAEENQLGDQAYAQVLSDARVSKNPRWNELVDRVGRRIAQAANEPSFDWKFTVIDSPERNAFCLPGGKIAVYTGILPLVRTEAGLAVVLGHEVAHATARHAGERITEMFVQQVSLAALSAILAGKMAPSDQKVLMGALGLAAVVGIDLPFSRAQEAQADEIGLIYTARAGYDPAAAPRFWERMEQEEGSTPAPAFLSDHPPSEKRRQALLAEQSRVAPLYAASPRYGEGERIESPGE